MEKTFQLPNQVVESNTAHSGIDQAQVMTSESKKVTTLTSVSGPCQIIHTNITCGRVEATLAKQATALRRLKWISVFLAISTALNTAMFGGFTHSLMTRMEDNEQISAKLDSNMAALLSRPPTIATYISADTTDIEMRLRYLESNQTQHHIDTETKFLNLESNQTKYRVDIAGVIVNIQSNVTTNEAISKENLHRLSAIESETMELERNQTEAHAEISKMRTGVEKLETDFDAHITNIQEDSDRLKNIETYIETERHTLGNLTVVVNELTTGSNMEFVTFQEYTNETRNIWANVEAVNATNEEHRTVLLQLQNDLGSVTTVVKNHTSRMIQVESDRSADRTSAELLSTRITQLEADLASESTIIEAHNESITDNIYSLIQLQTDIIVQNTTIQFATDRLSQLKENISQYQTNILLQETAIMQVEASLTAQNTSLQTQRSRIEELESQGISNTDMITDNTARLKELETNLSKTTANIFVERSINEIQTARVLELELRVNETRQKFEDYDVILTNDTGKVAFCVRLDRSLTNVRIGEVIKFETVQLNEGSGYDPTTGLFTAPAPGVYQFSYFVGHNYNPPGQTWARLMAKGKTVNSAVADAIETGFDIQGGNVGIVRLNTGEKAWIEAWWSDYADFDAGLGFSTFSGVFVYG